MIDYKEIIEQLKDEDVFRLMEKLGAQPINKQDYILCKTTKIRICSIATQSAAPCPSLRC